MQKQQEEEISVLTTKLAIKEKEYTKLKEDNRLLLKRSEHKEHKLTEVKWDKVPLLYVHVYVYT